MRRRDPPARPGSAARSRHQLIWGTAHDHLENRRARCGTRAAAGVGPADATAHGQTAVRAQSPAPLEISPAAAASACRFAISKTPTAPPQGNHGGRNRRGRVDREPRREGRHPQGRCIVEFDGERVRSVRQLTRVVRARRGRTVQAAIVREGQRSAGSIPPAKAAASGSKGSTISKRIFRYKIGSHAAAPARAGPPSPLGGLEVRRAGRPLDEPPGNLDQHAVATARRILRYERGSARLVGDRQLRRSQAGIKAGDVITSFNGSAVNDPSDVRRRAANRRMATSSRYR